MGLLAESVDLVSAVHRVGGGVAIRTFALIGNDAAELENRLRASVGSSSEHDETSSGVFNSAAFDLSRREGPGERRCCLTT